MITMTEKGTNLASCNLHTLTTYARTLCPSKDISLLTGIKRYLTQISLILAFMFYCRPKHQESMPPSTNKRIRNAVSASAALL